MGGPWYHLDPGGTGYPLICQTCDLSQGIHAPFIQDSGRFLGASSMFTSMTDILVTHGLNFNLLSNSCKRHSGLSMDSISSQIRAG